MGDDSRFRYRREDSSGQDGRRPAAPPPAGAPMRPAPGPAASPRPTQGAPAPDRAAQERAYQERLTARAPASARPPQGGGDPLAELARLIDEQDSFAEPAEAPRRPAAQEALRRDPSRLEALRAEASRLEALRAKQDATRQEYLRERQVREEQAREAHARQLRQQQIEERREVSRQELARQEQARQELARRESARQDPYRQETTRPPVARRELAPPAPRESYGQPAARPANPQLPPPRPDYGADQYGGENAGAARTRPEPPAFLMAGRNRAAPQGGEYGEQSLDPRQVAAAERSARMAARPADTVAPQAYGDEERGQAADPRAVAQQRRAASLHNPPSRTLLTPPSTADRIDEHGNSVRQGYGSLAHQRALQQEAEARNAGARQQAYQEAPPPPRAAPAQSDAGARADSAGYAYSAERRDSRANNYAEYDDSYDPDYADDGYMPPHGDEIYDGDQRRQKGRRALMAVGAAIAIVVLGTAGVFAYRMVSGGGLTASGNTPPVIRADTTPSKTITPPSAPDPQQKLIYDQSGGSERPNEQMLPREEQPVDVSTAAAPRATPPEGITPESTEPKRVRTLTVRADGSVVPDGNAGGASPSTQGLTAYSSDMEPIPGGAPEPNAVTTTTTTTAPADTPAVSRTGEFVVQVSSQRSAADAQGSWRALQTRYPNLLSSYTAAVKQVDLGERGIYYRAQVGPFASRDEANKLCQALRAQGGDCVVNQE